ncbi:hypothetical protein B0H13DRAFT_1851390 [Mycena leptocephala]|nr:hypothetical protein B0H13DRAFT_1851390 [Mycena leptocephala]
MSYKYLGSVRVSIAVAILATYTTALIEQAIFCRLLFRLTRSLLLGAIFLFLIGTHLFGGSHYHLNEIDNMDEETIKKIWRQRTAVLNAYPPDEILEMYASVCFLRGLLEKLMEDELTGTGDEDLYWLEILLSAGPASVRQAWEEGHYNILAQDLGFGDDIFDDDNKLFSGYFLRAFAGVWANRKLPPTTTPQNNEHPSRWILDSMNGGDK